MVKIAFDAKRAFNNATGLGNYSRFVITNLLQHFPKNQYILFTPKQNVGLLNRSGFKKVVNGEGINIVQPENLFSKRFHSLWRTYSIAGLVGHNKPNVFHGLSNELPVGIDKTGAKTIVTIHDLIFMRHPEYYGRADKLIYERKTRSACELADLVLATSDQTKQDLIHFLRIPEKKIQVAYQDCHELFYDEKNNVLTKILLDKYQIETPYIFCVSKLDKRKNHLNLVKAFISIEAKIPHTLILVGADGDATSDIELSIKKHRIRRLPNVPLEELPYLYDGADFSVYPSRFEGFGIPLLESLRRGKSVVSSKGSCFEEVAGGAGLYANADEPDEMAESLLKLSDANSRLGFETNIETVLKRFDRKLLADELMEVYKC